MNATVSPPADALVEPLTAIEQMIARRELSEAAQRLNVLVRQAPKDPRIYLLGSRLAAAAGNTQGSIDGARRAVEAAPGWGLAVAELALALARGNRFSDAMETAEAAVALDGSNPALLVSMINVAHRAQELDAALDWLTRAIQLSPQNMALRRLLASDLRLKGRHADALAVYTSILQATPDDTQALLGRLQTALEIHDQAAAQKDAEALLAANPADTIFQFWAALARGETPAHQPAEMVARLYDGGLAEVYDRHVINTLKYTLPVQVANRIVQWHPDRVLNLLDLGCGTGLLGASLRRIHGAMIGVEVSLRMIEQAIRRNVYDNIHQVDVLDALEGTSPSQYEVIAALDVFVYVGALEKSVQNAHRILKPGGRLVLSCEKAADDEADLVLRPSMRYAHRRAAVEAACKAAGYAEVEIEDLVLREEDQKPVDGFLVIARKA